MDFICLYSRHFTRENTKKEKSCFKFLFLFMSQIVDRWEMTSCINLDNLIGPTLNKETFFERLGEICFRFTTLPTASIDKMKRIESIFKKQGILEVASNLKKQNMDTEFILLVTGLTLEETEML